jgi:hypothetical protein
VNFLSAKSANLVKAQLAEAEQRTANANQATRDAEIALMMKQKELDLILAKIQIPLVQ